MAQEADDRDMTRMVKWSHVVYVGGCFMASDDAGRRLQDDTDDQPPESEDRAG